LNPAGVQHRFYITPRNF